MLRFKGQKWLCAVLTLGERVVVDATLGRSVLGEDADNRGLREISHTDDRDGNGAHIIFRQWLVYAESCLRELNDGF